MSRRLTGLAAVTVTFASALTLATASPAQAAAQHCISYLESVNRQTTARNAICETTEFLADNVSQNYAVVQCREAMEGTGLEWNYAGIACQAAAEEDDDD